MVAPRSPGGSAAEMESPRPGSLESRASLALKILAAINVAAVILAMFPGSIPTSELQTVSLAVGSGALAILYLLVARGLDRRDPWAVSTIRPLLLLIGVWGAYVFVAAFAAGLLRIPFTTLAASWALLGPMDRRPLPRLSGRGTAFFLATFLLIATELSNQPVFGWGGYFDVHRHDLSASLTVDCGPAGGAALPQSITISYEWSWSGSTLLANEDDVVVIGWNGDDAEGHPLYVFGDTPEEGEGIHLGSAGRVGVAMAAEAAGQWRGSLRWRIDLAARGIQPGRVEVTLMRAAEQPSEPQPLTVGASYVHVGVWRNDVRGVTCTW